MTQYIYFHVMLLRKGHYPLSEMSNVENENTLVQTKTQR
jgi:hypothetical protein